MVAQGAGANRECRIVGHQGPALAACAEILARIKTETGHRTKSADTPTAVFCSMGLGGVFDERDFMFAGNLQQRIEIRRMAIKMDGEDGAGTRSDGAFN